MLRRLDTEALLNLSLPPDPPEFQAAQLLLEDPSAPTNLSLEQSVLKEKLRDEEPDPNFTYEKDFEELVRDHSLFVAEVDASDLDTLAQQKKTEELTIEDQEWRQVRARIGDVFDLEHGAKANLKHEFSSKSKKNAKKLKSAGKETEEKSKLIDSSFAIAIKQLQSVIQERRTEVKMSMGDLRERSIKYLHSEATWNDQNTLELRFEVLRCVKDKLPCGHYVLFVSVWDRLGGNALEYSKEQRITIPKRHGGRYYQQSLKFEQCLSFRIPSISELRPNMVLSFELFLLSTGGVADKVAAHAFFPICNSDFTPIEGKFKVPMIRGDVNTTWDKFRDLERLYCKDLDKWIGNLYFQISRPETVAFKQTEIESLPVAEEKYTIESFELPEHPQLYPELKSPSQFDEYRTSVTSPDGLKSRASSYKKFRYMMSELLADLGLRTLRRADMYLTLSTLVLVCWVGRFFHYVAQWLYILAMGIQVVKFSALYLTLILRYGSNTPFGTEFGVTAIGPSALILLFLILCAVAVLSNRFFHWYPKIGYRVTVACGIVACFDWLVVLIESLCFGFIDNDWEGDSFKLYNYFDSISERPAMGGIITAMLYLTLSGLALFLLYVYLLYIHLGGRMLDVYTRLTAPETKFFLPMDSEVSENYLKWVCAKAHKFTNVQGQTRKIVIGEYTMNDLIDPSRLKTLSHVAIYTETEDGKKQVYRHFVRMPDGAICEMSAESNRMSGLEDNSG